MKIALPIRWLFAAAVVSPVLFAQSRVPFVGCKSDGQVGPLKAPIGTSVSVPISAKLASQLAYYKAEYSPGVLAPRGWHCFSTYGSNGASLFVAPEPIDSKQLFSDKWEGFAGDAIQVSIKIGDTSGRFEVARTIARLFPARMAFVDNIIKEKIEPASDFPRGLYPHDKVTYRNKNIAEYTTPAQTDGLGTDSMLRKNDTPISGAAILAGETPDVVAVNIRLSANLLHLAPTIIRQAEREAAKPDQYPLS